MSNLIVFVHRTFQTLLLVSIVHQRYMSYLYRSAVQPKSIDQSFSNLSVAIALLHVLSAANTEKTYLRHRTNKYRSQSHYSDTRPTSPDFILLLLNVWRGKSKHRCNAFGFARPGLEPVYKANSDHSDGDNNKMKIKTKKNSNNINDSKNNNKANNS